MDGGRRKKVIAAFEVERNRDSFNCDKCNLGRHCDDSNPASYPILAVKTKDKKHTLLESNVCFLPMCDDFTREILELFPHYKNGILPLTGGLYEQPDIYNKAMTLADLLWQN